ncbi:MULTISPECIES: exodeoxyribonuclease VII small subunit [Luteimonas]|uniref:exodeoxyribonuclease VII small subunit n=1 Tax=Luteimonas TaxID=83614 RepID=UPI000C7D82A8|nr:MULTISPECIES: exodeoxyribonuclease VII small subunit [Luteimonas]
MPKKSATAETPSPVADFENALGQLEQLVEKMEAGEMSLEESLGAYERGVSLYRQCQQALEDAEQRVRLLSDPAAPERAQPFAPLPGDARDA